MKENLQLIMQRFFNKRDYKVTINSLPTHISLISAHDEEYINLGVCLHVIRT